MIRKLISRAICGVLVLASLPITHLPAHAASCETSYTQGTLNLVPSHGKVFYIDTGVSPRIDATYVGYRLKNNGGSDFNGWVSLTNFTGGVVSLANPDDAYQQLPTISAGATKTVYFLVKASISTRVAQTHTVSVFTTRPDVAGASPSLTCDFSFTKVAETIKAAANKVTSISVSGDGTPEIGELITVTALGAAGTIGAGSIDIGRILWFSPSAFSSFPTAALRLESVRLMTADNANWNNSSDVRVYEERLLIDTATAPDAGTTTKEAEGVKSILSSTDNLVGKRYYKNYYRFRVIGKSATAVSMKPVAQISSGTQIKHTDLTSTPSASINTQSTSISLTVVKSVTSTSGLAERTVDGTTYFEVPYKITIDNTAASGTVIIDEIVDTPAALVRYLASSVSVNSGTATEPVFLSSESGLSPQPLHFFGPFSVSSATNFELSYTMLVPKTANTYKNSAIAYIGSQQIGANSSSISIVNVVTNGTSVTSAISGTESLSPVVRTLPATAVTTTGATLNGTVDPNGTTPNVYFHWSTSSTLATYDTITVTSPATGNDVVAQSENFTGGSSGTTYYYRIVAVVGSTSYNGGIENFTVYEAAADPTVTTTSASSITSTSAILNGVVDPNLRSVTAIRFRYGTNSSTVSGGTASATTLTSETETGTENATLSGANPTDVSLSISGLSNNNTYYFRAEITYLDASNVSQTLNGEVLNFTAFTPGATAQTISFNAISNQNLGTGTYQTTASASSGLQVQYTSETNSICTVDSSGLITFVTTGTCIITVSQPGNTTYAAAESVTRQFDILNQATLSYDPNDATSGSAPSASTNDVGTTLTVSSNSGNLTRTNFTFAGWNTLANGTGTSYPAGSGSLTLNSNTTLFAKWEATITYNANGAAGSPPDSQTSVAGPIALRNSVNTLTYDGFTFIGWNTQANGLGDPYDLGATYNLQGDVTLYATWQDNSSVRITYNGLGYTGGTLPSIVQVAPGTDTATATTDITKNGLTFGGWSTSSSYTDSITPGTSIRVDANITLYAIWNASISYDPNNGSGSSPSPSTVKENGSHTTESNPYTRSGYTFSGWNTAAGGSGTSYNALATFTVTQTITLYAQWTANTYTITYDGNGGSGTTSPATFTYGNTATISSNNFTRSGYTFSNWNTVSGGSGTRYDPTDSYSSPADLNLYAIWTQNSSGGGSAPAPIVTPGPVITTLSVKQICSIGNDVTISGAYFTDGTVKLDGQSVVVKSLTSTSILVSLPTAASGNRTIQVTTPHGSATAIIEYVTAPKPKFGVIRIPYLSQGSAIYLPLSAEGANAYILEGQLPSGLTLNRETGLLSGTASENGIFVFTLVASGICGDTNQLIELDIDAPTPNAVSHRINFTPNSCEIPDSAKASLERFIDQVKGIAPRNIIPEIYISGGAPSTDPDDPTAQCRQDAICDFLLLENLLGQVLTDVFTGSPNRIEIIVYFPRPNDDL